MKALMAMESNSYFLVKQLDYNPSI